LVVPDFLSEEDDVSSRKLQGNTTDEPVKKISIKELNVNKDIIAVEFFLNSELKP